MQARNLIAALKSLELPSVATTLPSMFGRVFALCAHRGATERAMMARSAAPVFTKSFERRMKPYPVGLR